MHQYAGGAHQGAERPGERAPCRSGRLLEGPCAGRRGEQPGDCHNAHCGALSFWLSLWIGNAAEAYRFGRLLFPPEFTRGGYSHEKDFVCGADSHAGPGRVGPGRDSAGGHGVQLCPLQLDPGRGKRYRSGHRRRRLRLSLIHI